MTEMLIITNAVYLDEIRDALTDEDRKPKYRGDPNLMRGQCYVASEVLYFGKLVGVAVPMTLRMGDEPHWYLRSTIVPDMYVDPTADQFPPDTEIPYDKGTPRGFLTKGPSKRAQKVLERLGWDYEHNAHRDSSERTGGS
jgi:hypothetical protein